jgi:hypothetical protein
MRPHTFLASLAFFVAMSCISAGPLAQGNPSSKLPPDPWPRVVDLSDFAGHLIAV